jgi:hypothetical protein
VLPERCERFRVSFSLHLDGMLSRFETVLLERHFRRCGPCRAFAAATEAQTQLLRAAPLAGPERSLADVLLQPKPVLRRRRVAALAGAVVVAATAAILALTPATGPRGESSSNASSPLLAVFPASPSPNATFEVPRLRVVSPASADGAVRGYFGRPAAPI